MENLKLVNLNIEGDKHLSQVSDFLKNENPDIVCLQEILSKDVEYFKNLMQMDGTFAPTTAIKRENKLQITPGTEWGIMVLTNLKPVTYSTYYYAGSKDALPEFKDDYHNSDCRALIIMSYETEGKKYQVANTHFTWSQGGTTSDMQRQHFKKLLDIISPFDNFILCGDFNAPRGLEIWDELAKRYRDNIPQNITTTIDQNLHRAQGIQLVVDGIFSSPSFKVEDVQVKDGLSDHMAIVATISTAI